MLQVIRTTLSEANNGKCQSANNTRYNGSTVSWIISTTSDVDDQVMTCKTKKQAEKVSSWGNNQNTNWERADLEMSYDMAINND